MRSAYMLSLAVCLGACGSKKTPPLADLGTDLAAHGDLAVAPGDLGSPSCLPAGYSVVPFFPGDPVYTFDQADPTLTSGKDYIVVLETDVGCIAIDLYEMVTPITVNSFVFLGLHHFYDGMAFHRVIDGFVAQTGDPNSISGTPDTWGLGGPGYSFGLEVTPSLNYDAAGVVGMARGNDVNSNGSQFFITFDAAPSLNQQYTIFGKVIAGIDVLPKIVRGEPPAMPTRILAATIAIK